MLKTAAVLAVEQIMFFRCTVSYICTKCQINYKIMEDLISYLMSMKSGINLEHNKNHWLFPSKQTIAND